VPGLDELTRRGRSLGGERPALLDASGTWTYEALAAAASAAARRLVEAGYRPGHRLAVRLPTGAAMLTTLLGALEAGLTVGLLSHHLGSAAIALRLRDLDPDLVIDDPCAPLSIAPPSRPPRSLAGAVVLWTSGTSGLPSGVVFDATALLWNAGANAAALGLRDDDRALVQLDGAYSYALVHQIFSHWLVGASIAVPGQPPWLARVAGDIERWSATTLAVVPSMLQAMLRAPALRASLGALRVLTVGGGAAGEEMLRGAAARVGGALYVTYGLTEAGPRVCTRRFFPDRPPSPGLVGRPLPGVEVRLDGEGELWVRSPSGRAACIQSGDLVPLGPWIRTGDLATLDAEGAVRIVGRRKRMINRAGLKIAPAEIESVLRAHPRVADARVVAAPHGRLGEVPRAYVVPGAPPPPPSELARHCLEQLGPDWVPAAIELVAELPPEVGPWKDAASIRSGGAERDRFGSGGR